MHYETKVDEVAAEDIAAYRRAVLKVEDAASFYIENSPQIAAASASVQSGETGKGLETMAGSTPLSKVLFSLAIIVIPSFLTWLGLILAFRRADKKEQLQSV